MPNPLEVRAKASEGQVFSFGDTSLYVGPREPAPNSRNLKRPPVLAFSRRGDEIPTIVAEFPNSASAEKLIRALVAGVDEMRGAILHNAAEQDAKQQQPDENDAEYLARITADLPAVQIIDEGTQA